MSQAKSIKTFDFSILYTMVTYRKLFDMLYKMIDICIKII